MRKGIFCLWCRPQHVSFLLDYSPSPLYINLSLAHAAVCYCDCPPPPPHSGRVNPSSWHMLTLRRPDGRSKEGSGRRNNNDKEQCHGAGHWGLRYVEHLFSKQSIVETRKDSVVGQTYQPIAVRPAFEGRPGGVKPGGCRVTLWTIRGQNWYLGFESHDEAHDAVKIVP